MTPQPTPDSAPEAPEQAPGPTNRQADEQMPRQADDGRTGPASSADATTSADPSADASTSADPSADAPTAADSSSDAPVSEAPTGTTMYMRRRRVPTLGFWVTLAIIVGLLAGAITALITHVEDLGGVIYFAVTGGVFIGLPLALIAAIVDSVAHRGERRRPR